MSYSPVDSIDSGNPPSQQGVDTDDDLLVGHKLPPRSLSPADDALSLLGDEPVEESGQSGSSVEPGPSVDSCKARNSASPVISSNINNIAKKIHTVNNNSITSTTTTVMDNAKHGVDSLQSDNNLDMHLGGGDGTKTVNTSDIANTSTNHAKSHVMTVAADIHSQGGNTSQQNRDVIVTSTPVAQQRTQTAITSNSQGTSGLETSINNIASTSAVFDTSSIQEHTGIIENENDVSSRSLENSHSNDLMQNINKQKRTDYHKTSGIGISPDVNRLVRSRSGSGSGSGADSPATYHSITLGGSIQTRDRHGSFTSSGTQTSTDFNNRIKTPILGYEIMEERSRFTVFKVQVKISAHDSWFIFRRYTDFTRLNDKLRELFPLFRLALPPKRWFGGNYDREFLDDRKRGLQAFLNNIMGHSEVSESKHVKQFLCLDNPPGGHESLEESKALCESMEEEIYHLHQDVEEKDTRISLLQEELELQRLEIENLKKTLKLERTSGRRRASGQSLVSMQDLTEAEQQHRGTKLSKEGSPFKKSPSKDRVMTNQSPSSIAEEDIEEAEETSSTESNSPGTTNNNTAEKGNNIHNHSKTGFKSKSSHLVGTGTKNNATKKVNNIHNGSKTGIKSKSSHLVDTGLSNKEPSIWSGAITGCNDSKELVINSKGVNSSETLEGCSKEVEEVTDSSQIDGQAVMNNVQSGHVQSDTKSDDDSSVIKASNVQET